MKQRLVTVAVSGAFDPIHVGHVRYIREAAKLGDRLVVILNSDDFLLRKKGFVFMPFGERKEILENVKGVDEVISSVDEDQTVCKTLELVKPKIFAKGGDRTGPENIPEAETCCKIGCKLVTNVGGDKIRSNSELSWKIKELGIEDTSRLRIMCPYCGDHPILKEKCLYCKGTGKIEVRKSDQETKETKRSEKRAIEEIEQLARDRARRKALFAREQPIGEAQEARKLKPQKQSPE